MNDTNVGGVKVMREVEGVQVVNICTFIDAVMPEHWTDYEPGAYGRLTAKLTEWCKANDASYFSAPRESFSIGRAVSQAEVEGHKVVVVEDLS